MGYWPDVAFIPKQAWWKRLFGGEESNESSLCVLAFNH